MARLVLLSEGFTGRAYELKAPTTTVGRVSDNAFEIPEASVSSHHAEILLRGTEVVVRDLNSTNGTYIAGERITSEAVLKPGQILRLGTVDMRLETGDAAPKPKQALDHTRVIPQGVKADELFGTGARPEFKTTGFEKKSDRGSKIFLVFAIAFGIVLFGALIWVLTHRGEQ
ncbi:MAG TPA: FHA domain-containing protein [Verrucomicrobiae bacterium]|nr:FHA domain-containing protein [Verrucomicrobiae bacterium]